MQNSSHSTEHSHNTNATYPSYQSMEDTPPRMPESVGGHELHRSATSALGVGDEDVEMGGFVPPSEKSDSFRRLDSNDEDDKDSIPDVEVVFDTIEGGNDDSNNQEEEEEDQFPNGSSVSSTSTGTPQLESPKYDWQLYALDTKNIGKFLR